jgi:5-methylcytosine-specific restriction endonuclease McrA
VLVIHRSTLVPLSPGFRKFTATFDEETVDLLLRAQALLGRTLPSSDYEEVLKRVLQDWVRATECRKYGLTEQPRKRRSAGNGRYVPADVKRAVFKRDGGRCTSVGDDKHRCGTRKSLEFDHVTPFAKGGLTTVGDLRLRCRRHNQVEADRAFGESFMDRKREQRAARPPAPEPGIQIQDASARVLPA